MTSTTGQFMQTTNELPYCFSDRSIRDELKKIPNLRDFLLDAIPEVAKDLDFEHVEFLDGEFITDDWRGRESDLLVRIPWIGGDEALPVLICVLIEHQSRPDPRISFRTLLYAVLHWDREWKAWETQTAPRDEFKLTPIIPIVLHTGPQQWGRVKTVGDLFVGPDLFKVFAPQWSVLVWDLAEKSPQSLLSSTAFWLKSLAVLRAGSLLIEVFEETLPQFIAELEALSVTDSMRWHDLKRFVLSWCIKLRDASERDRVFRIAQQAELSRFQQEPKAMPSIADSLLEQGRTEGHSGGFIRGQHRERREMLEYFLQSQFGDVPVDIQDWIIEHEDSDVLRTATQRVVRMQSIDEFRSYMASTE